MAKNTGAKANKKVTTNKTTTRKNGVARTSSEIAKYVKKLQDAKKAYKTAENNTVVADKKLVQAKNALKKAASAATSKKTRVTEAAKKRATADVQKIKTSIVTLKAREKVSLEKVRDAEFELGLMEKKSSAMEKAVAAFTRHWEREFNMEMRQKIAARKARKNQKLSKKVETVKKMGSPKVDASKPKDVSKPTVKTGSESITRHNHEPVIPVSKPVAVEPPPTPMSALDAAIALELSRKMGGNAESDRFSSSIPAKNAFNISKDRH